MKTYKEETKVIHIEFGWKGEIIGVYPTQNGITYSIEWIDESPFSIKGTYSTYEFAHTITLDKKYYRDYKLKRILNDK